jgi:mono/diheme cytochrome c family protein
MRRRGDISTTESQLDVMNSFHNITTRRALGILLAACVMVSVGCSPTYEEPPYRMNHAVATEVQMIGNENAEDDDIYGLINIAGVLEALFGTPDHPFVLEEATGLRADLLQAAAGPVRVDNTGEQRGLYRRHCVHCHGITGDGMGPTAAFLRPYPRDYRQGKFKFKSTTMAAKPTSHDTPALLAGTKEDVPSDLKRTLLEGIPGTSMPSFRTLPNEDLDALIEYVKYLSIRGQMEEALMREVSGLIEGENLEYTKEYLVDELLAGIADPWKEASSHIIAPPAEPKGDLTESIAAGRILFYSKKANCVSCHGTEALGDGQIQIDVWNEFKALGEKQHAALLEMGAILPKQMLPPRNLRQGVFRGGGRPLDVYRRVAAGIPGAKMQAFSGTLTPEEIWHLVHFVRNLPYEPASRSAGDAPGVQRDRL